MASNGKSAANTASAKYQTSIPPSVAPNGKPSSSRQKTVGYQSEGVKDNDIFNLPSSDWQLLGFLTLLAAFVRLFRIYQPSSVVFDEVQYVIPRNFSQGLLG
jgi:dolichyl-phosphate-mannose-protein mannosyltransferase